MPVTDSKFIKNIKSARRAGVPLLAIETADPASCIRQIRANAQKVPLVCWDPSTGFSSKNTEGEQVLTQALGDGGGDNWSMTDFAPALRTAVAFPGKTGQAGGTILFIMNGHKFIEPMHPDFIENMQALWNLRDEYKKNVRTIVILCPSITLPEELKHDFLVLDEPLPSDKELEGIVKSMYESGGIKIPEDGTVDRAVEAVKGLSAFAAEQVVAMSLTKEGLDLDSLWERKRKTVELTPGLKIWRGGETFADVRGVQNMKDYLTMIMTGEEAPTVVLFMDELEKQMAGSTGGGEGTSQEMHGQLLSWMSDNDILGLLMVGHPGCSKSFISKAVGGQFKRPTVVLSLSEMKSKWVGESSQFLKGGMKLISAIGRPLVMATCNSIDNLSPEMRSRFELGTFFFDLPTEDERKAVWDLYTKKYKLKADLSFDENNWTPREIRACCNLAWRLKCSLEKASHYIVPVIRSAPERIEKLRKLAHGKFLSSAYEGTYEIKQGQESIKRTINFDQTGTA